MAAILSRPEVLNALRLVKNVLEFVRLSNPCLSVTLWCEIRLLTQAPKDGGALSHAPVCLSVCLSVRLSYCLSNLFETWLEYSLNKYFGQVRSLISQLIDKYAHNWPKAILTFFAFLKSFIFFKVRSFKFDTTPHINWWNLSQSFWNLKLDSANLSCGRW